jgi:HK97 family phage prohead protease
MKNNTDFTGETGAAAALQEFGGRVVRLCDGRAGLRGGLVAEIREVPGAENRPVIEFVASDETLDRYEEIIVASGWRLEAYRRNPVFQNAHQYGDILFTLGKALETGVRDGRLYQRVEFATEANPVARVAYRLYQGRFLNAVSVGFVPLRWENGAADAGYRRKYLEQELLEVSAVGIPANPNALALALRAGAIERADLREWRDLLARLASMEFGSPDPATCSDRAAWLRLARELSGLLRR